MTEAMNLPSPEPLDAATSALQTVTQAARDGAADAQVAAERVWSSASLFVSRFVYTTCYTISYGVVFPSVLLARTIPKDNIAVRGLIDGASDAIRKAEEVRGLPVESPAAN